jgi:hypothetical protein
MNKGDRQMDYVRRTEETQTESDIQTAPDE